MDRVPGPPAGVTSQPVFVDGFGARYEMFDAESGEPDDLVEVLAFAPQFVEAADFASTLGIRVARLASIQHALFAHARRLDQPTEDSLLLVSDRVRGWRLADVLDVAEQHRLTFEIGAVMNLMGQLIPTVAQFAQHQRELAVGTIGPEHLILTAQGRLVLTEYVLGSAIEKLSLSREILWHRLRIASTPGPTKIWTRSDVLSIGMVCLSLLHGRRLRETEFPGALGDLLDEVREPSGDRTPLSPKLAAWVSRALQLEGASGFQTPADAKLAFEQLLANERDLSPTRRSLDAFIADFKEAIEPTSPTGEESSLSYVEELVSSVVFSAPPPAPAFEPEAPTEPESEPDVEAERPKPEPPKPEPPKPALSSPPPQKPVAPPVVAAKPPVVERRTPAQPAPVVIAAPVAEPITVAESRFPIDLREWKGRAIAAVALAAVEFIAIVWLWNRSSESLTGEGELVVQSRPPGAAVTVDDKDLGTTPVMVRLSPGTYTLKVQIGAEEPRVIPIQIKPGVQTAQYLELRDDR